MVYTIKNRCLESPDLSYEDGAATLFLNTKGTEGEIPEDLRDLMRYLNQTIPENAVTEKLEKVQKIVEQKKLDPKVRGDFMTWEEYLEEEREEAREEAREEVREEAREEARKEAEQKVEAERKKAEAAEQKLADAQEEIRQLKEQLMKQR